MGETVWLPVTGTMQVGLDREEALSWGVRDFMRLYRRTVLSASRAEAKRWAREQVRMRDQVQDELEAATERVRS